MKKIILVLIHLFWVCKPGISHEHWLHLDNYFPAPGERVTVTVASGHYFPRSALVLGDRVLCDTLVWGPGGPKGYTTAKDKKCRKGTHVFASDGVYLVNFHLKKSQMKEPVYFARAIVHVGGKKGDPSKYRVRRGLEIVPAKDLLSIRENDSLPLVVLYDGVPVKAAGSVFIEGGRRLYLKPDPEGTLVFKVKGPGRYLVSVSFRGKGCSLAFRLK